MKNWNRSEIIAVVALVALIGFLVYVGVTVELEGDLVGKATSTTYAQATPYFYNGGWNSALPSKGVAYVYVYGGGKQVNYVYKSYDASHILVSTRRDTHPPSSSSGSSSSGGFLDTSTGVLRDAEGNPILSSGSDGAATSGGAASPAGGGGGSAAPVAIPPASAGGTAGGGAIAIPPGASGTGGGSGATHPSDYNPYFFNINNNDASGNPIQDSNEPTIYLPKSLGTPKSFSGDTVTFESGHTWTLSEGGQTLIRRDNAGNVYQYRYSQDKYLYKSTDAVGKPIEMWINGAVVNPGLADQFLSLNPSAAYAVSSDRNSVTVTSQRGGVHQTRTLTLSTDKKTVTDVTTTTVSDRPAITRTTITTQLDGGGTATWSGGAIDKPGSLLIRDAARGETWSFDGVKKNGDGSYGTQGGPMFFNPNTGILYEGQKSDTFERHEISFEKDGSTRDLELHDDNTIDEEFIYYKNGDWGRTTFDGQNWAHRERYDRGGRLQGMTFANDPGFAYVDVADYFRQKRADANNDGTVTRDEALAVGVPENIWGTIDANHNNILNDVLPLYGNENEAVLRVPVNPDDTLGVPVDAQTETQSERVDDENDHIEKNFETFEDKSDAGVLANLFAGYHSKQGLSNLLFGKAFLNDWREKVDEQFAQAYLGVDYWTSEMCSYEFDVVGDSVAAVETAGGLVQFIGTAQGEVAGSVPVLCDAQDECKVGTCRKRDKVCVDSSDKVILEHFYKITYGVVAPSDKRLTPYYDEDGAISFNIVVSGRDKTASLFTQFVELDNGQSAASKAPKPSPILHFSPVVYDKVCLVFGKKAVDRNGDNVDQVCNPIKAATGSFENFQRNTAGAPVPNRGEPEFNTEW